MNSEITCQQCQRLFSSPIILSCCTSPLCSTCLSNISYKSNNDQKKLYYNCPFCKKISEDAELVSDNKFLEDFINDITNKEKKIEKECDRCEKLTKYENIVICNECNNKSLCEECSNQIHNSGKFKFHERTSYTKGVVHHTTFVRNLAICDIHPKEKIEYICPKDSKLICPSCVVLHKQACKMNPVTLKETYKDLLNQLTLKFEKLVHQKSFLNKSSDNLKQSLDDLEKNYEKAKLTLKSQFDQIQSIIEYKYQESELYLNYIFSKAKSTINEEIKTTESYDSWIGNIMNMIDFATSYQNSSFIQGSKYLFSRIDSLLNQVSSKSFISCDTTFPALACLDECKEILYKMNFIPVSSKITHYSSDQLRSRVNNSKPNTSRSNTPRAQRPTKYEAPANKPYSPSCRSIEPTKSSRTNPSSVISNRSQLDNSTKKLTPRNMERQDRKPTPSRINITNFTEGADSPKFSTSQSRLLSTQGNEEDELLVDNLKMNKKFARAPIPSPVLTNNFNGNGSNSSNLITDNGTHTQNYFIRNLDIKRTSFGETKLNKGFPYGDSKEEGNFMKMYDVHHLTELQRNPQVKRIFTKVAQTASTIFIAWTHPFNNPNIQYLAEYGIGTKMQGAEQFRAIYRGPSHNCTISGLMPKTTYRIRVCPVIMKNKGENGESYSGKEKEAFGQWSDIINVTTKDLQTIDPETLGINAKHILKGDKNIVEFDKSGMVIASNGYSYGKVSWEVKLQQQAAHQSTDDSTSFVKIGITNKMGKPFNIIGSMINYGLNTQSPTLKLILDLDNRTLTIYSSQGNKEVFNSLPEGTLYPVFSNKTNKNANSSLKLVIQFDIPVE